ncbi:MAG: hypothetical protein J6C19_01950 [Lachnospiraceae bacterium]|nr:hypothetical protein [Lachnospiraceae bacterium]
MKKLILLCMAGVMMMGTVGCAMTGAYEKKAERRLEDRYGISFQVERVISRNIFDGYYEVLAYPEDDPDMLVRASVDFEGEGESDDYAIKLLCRKISDRVARKMDNLNGTYLINTVPALPVYGFFDTNMTIEQYMEKFPMDSFRICINYNPDELDVNALYRVLADAAADLDCLEYNSYICLHLVSGRDLAGIQQYLKEHDKEYADYVWNEPCYLVGNFDFACGKFTMAESEIKSTIAGFREKYMKEW